LKVYKFIFLFLFCSNLFAQEKNLFLKENDKVIRLMTKFLQKNEIPGLSLSISYKKEIIFSKGFGFSDLKLRKEVNPSKTKFRIASISKTLTAVSLAKLQEEGKISFKESVYKYLDSLPKTNYDITIEDLLSHKAGLVRDYGGSILCEKNDFYKNSFYSSYNNDRFITAPQIGFSYSNYGYKLLGILIEKISGKTIQNVKNDLIINKIGLSNTTHETSNYDENTTKFYYKKDKEFLEVPCLDCTFNYGPGCGVCTVGTTYIVACQVSADGGTWIASS
jgi:CubicO group peptidase (beta-lactamase class C family)